MGLASTSTRLEDTYSGATGMTTQAALCDSLASTNER